RAARAHARNHRVAHVAARRHLRVAWSPMAQLRGLVGAVLLGACFHDAGVVSGGPSTSAGETTTTSATTTASATTTTTSAASTTDTSATTTSSGATATSDASVGTTLRPPADQGAADLGPLPAACPDDPDLVACYLFDDGW